MKTIAFVFCALIITSNMTMAFSLTHSVGPKPLPPELAALAGVYKVEQCESRSTYFLQDPSDPLVAFYKFVKISVTALNALEISSPNQKSIIIFPDVANGGTLHNFGYFKVSYKISYTPGSLEELFEKTFTRDPTRNEELGVNLAFDLAHPETIKYSARGHTTGRSESGDVSHSINSIDESCQLIRVEK